MQYSFSKIAFFLIVIIYIVGKKKCETHNYFKRFLLWYAIPFVGNIVIAYLINTTFTGGSENGIFMVYRILFSADDELFLVFASAIKELLLAEILFELIKRVKQSNRYVFEMIAVSGLIIITDVLIAMGVVTASIFVVNIAIALLGFLLMDKDYITEKAASYYESENKFLTISFSALLIIFSWKILSTVLLFEKLESVKPFIEIFSFAALYFAGILLLRILEKEYKKEINVITVGYGILAMLAVGFIHTSCYDANNWKYNMSFCMRTVVISVIFGITVYVVCSSIYKIWVSEKNVKEKLVRIVIWLALWFVAVSEAANRIYLSDYIPINGDFQNYNVWRRFLDGQAPYKDFSVYLGAGHLYIGAAFTWLFGGTFTDSMFISNLLVSFITILFIYVIIYSILKSKTVSLSFTALITLMVKLNSSYYLELPYDLKSSLRGIFEIVDSARTIRASVVLIIVVLCAFILKRQKSITIFKKPISENKMKVTLIALISGSAIAFSNDVGVSSYISLSFIYFLYLVTYYKKQILKIVQGTFYYIGVSFLGFCTVVLFASRGHFISYLKELFGVASYQKWYFTLDIQTKCVNIRELYWDGIAMIGLVIIIYNLYKVVKCSNKDINDRLFPTISAYIGLTAYISATFYLIQSGKDSHDLLYLYIYCSIIAYIVKLGMMIIRRTDIEKKQESIGFLFSLGVSVVMIVTIVPICNVECNNLRSERNNAVYISELDGYLSEFGESLNSAKSRVGESSLFSTYASAIEVMLDKYQPTGYDYIIHALGKKQQENYINEFRNNDYDYAQTIDLNYTYGVWMMNANWYFYKELFSTYEPSFETEFSQYWVKSKKSHILQDLEFGVTINSIDESSSEIIVECDKKVDCIVDVQLSYSNNKINSFLKTGDLSLYTHVLDDVTVYAFGNSNPGYFVPVSSDSRNVPMMIKDGKGRLLMNSYPANNSKLSVKSATVTQAIEFPYEIKEYGA